VTDSSGNVSICPQKNVPHREQE